MLIILVCQSGTIFVWLEVLFLLERCWKRLLERKLTKTLYNYQRLGTGPQKKGGIRKVVPWSTNFVDQQHFDWGGVFSIKATFEQTKQLNMVQGTTYWRNKIYFAPTEGFGVVCDFGK